MLFFFQPISEFIDNVCKRCRNLETFEYEGGYPDSKISNVYPELPIKEEDKFPKLTYIKVAIDMATKEYRLHLFDLDKGVEDDAILDNFKNYLTAKCPNLKNPIQIELVQDNVRSRSFAFESK